MKLEILHVKFQIKIILLRRIKDMSYQKPINNLNFFKNNILRKIFVCIVAFSLCFSNSMMVFAEPEANNDFIKDTRDFQSFMDTILEKKDEGTAYSGSGYYCC